MYMYKCSVHWCHTHSKHLKTFHFRCKWWFLWVWGLHGTVKDYGDILKCTCKLQPFRWHITCHCAPVGLEIHLTGCRYTGNLIHIWEYSSTRIWILWDVEIYVIIKLCGISVKWTSEFYKYLFPLGRCFQTDVDRFTMKTHYSGKAELIYHLLLMINMTDCKSSCQFIYSNKMF